MTCGDEFKQWREATRRDAEGRRADSSASADSSAASVPRTKKAESTAPAYLVRGMVQKEAQEGDTWGSACVCKTRRRNATNPNAGEGG
jgi:hypothetical protein